MTESVPEWLIRGLFFIQTWKMDKQFPLNHTHTFSLPPVLPAQGASRFSELKGCSCPLSATTCPFPHLQMASTHTLGKQKCCVCCHVSFRGWQHTCWCDEQWKKITSLHQCCIPLMFNLSVSRQGYFPACTGCFSEDFFISCCNRLSLINGFVSMRIHLILHKQIWDSVALNYACQAATTCWFTCKNICRDGRKV